MAVGVRKSKGVPATDGNSPVGINVASTGVMPGFVLWATDSLRVVEFIHEYAIPANLWGGGTGTRTTVPGLTLRYRASPQTVTLNAVVSATTFTSRATPRVA